MMTPQLSRHNGMRARGMCSGARGFTLTELLVAMGIIALLSTLTVVSISALARDSRLASSRNTVVAALGTARAYAMKNNSIVLVLFRARWDDDRPEQRQVTELLLAAWTGSTILDNCGDLADLYRPIPGILPRELSHGIKVAGPWQDQAANTGNAALDEQWITQPDFRAITANDEVPGRMFGLLFGPTGELLTRNPNSSGGDSRSFVDLDGDGFMNTGTTTGGSRCFEYDEPDDEVNINPVTFLCVYDDDQARELYDAGGWSDLTTYLEDLAGPEGYITTAADRIHFNRYTGVVMK